MALSPRTHWIQEDPVLVENWSLESNGSKSPTSFRSLQADEPSKCAACQYGKQHRRPIPGSTPSTIIRDRTNILKADNVIPGIESLSITSSAAREDDFYLRWKTKADEMYGRLHLRGPRLRFRPCRTPSQPHTHETLKAKEKFELTCRQYGVVPQEYLADNSKIFTSAEFTRNLDIRTNHEVRWRWCTHHNGIAERNIRTIMAIARTMMLHAAIHWPSIADATLWPLAVNHAVFWSTMFLIQELACPADLFTKTRWEQRKLNNLHVWGCPVYVLDKMISDGKIPIVLNPQTGYITPQFHVVFDDWFATVPASVDDLPNFNADSWKRMFRDSTYQYILDDEDQERLIVETENFEREQDVLSQQQRIATAIDAATPPSALPVDLLRQELLLTQRNDSFQSTRRRRNLQFPRHHC
ncbi:hypothetical protein MHU86_6171 [Fragilaria crotonensis]|nr:hypothetical protein MHU86_6171 [Fragilaria crotonensis]